MGLKKLQLWLLLLISVQLVIVHPFLALSQTASDLNQEQKVTTRNKSFPRRLSMLAKMGRKQKMTVVIDRVAVGGHGGGGAHGVVGGGRGGAGGRSSPRSQGGGGVIPVYAGGAAMNHNRNSHKSNGGIGTLNSICLNYLILALFITYFFLLFTFNN